MENVGKKFCCTYENCKASFSKNSKLTIHQRIHTGERPFKCDYSNCDKSYTSKSHLKRHIDTFHLELVEKYKCKICSLTLSNLTNYKRHQNRIHNPEKKYPFLCKDCSQGFYRKHQLVEHMYIHTGEAPYKCPHCRFGFTRRNRLNKHLKTHREYKCNCGQVFQRWSELLQHKKIDHKKNSTEKFICEKCNKHFIQKSSLKEHMKNHDSFKDVFVCPEENCSREYLYKRNLLQHIRIVHRGHHFKCNVSGCSKTLQTKQKLQQHLKMHEKLKMGIKRQIVRKQRVSRKGCKGKLTRSVILKLSGLSGRVPTQLENAVISGEKVDIENIVIDNKENFDENLNNSKLIVDELRTNNETSDIEMKGENSKRAISQPEQFKI